MLKRKNFQLGDRVLFNVGGQLFETTFATLTTHREHALLKMFDEEGVFRKRCDNEPIFIDRNPSLFPHIIDFLRKGKVNLVPDQTWLEDLLDEATYYGIAQLAQLVRERLDQVSSVEADNEADRSYFKWKRNSAALSTCVSSPVSPLRQHRYGNYEITEKRTSECSVPIIHPSFDKNSIPGLKVKTNSNNENSCYSSVLFSTKENCFVKPEYSDTLTSVPSITTPTNRIQHSLYRHSVHQQYKLTEEDIELSKWRQYVMNDNPSPPISARIAEYDLGPKLLHTDEEF